MMMTTKKKKTKTKTKKKMKQQKKTAVHLQSVPSTTLRR